MRLSELQTKDIINIQDGKKIGNIIDVIIESDTGKMKCLIVESLKTFSNLFGGKEEFEVVWEQIEKIGEDVILVKL